MFLVINKSKIYSYIITVAMVVVLFSGASLFTSGKESVQTSASTSRLLPIYSVETKEKNLALTMNCAWNADDIDSILDTLAKNQVHITFFVVGDWVDKYPEAVKKIYEAGHEIGNHSRNTSTCK